MTQPLGAETSSQHIRNALQVLELARPGRRDQGRVLDAGEVKSITDRLWKAIHQLEQTPVVSPSLQQSLNEGDGAYRP